MDLGLVMVVANMGAVLNQISKLENKVEEQSHLFLKRVRSLRITWYTSLTGNLQLRITSSLRQLKFAGAHW